MYLEIRILDDKKAEDTVREIRRIVSRGAVSPVPSLRGGTGQGKQAGRR